MRRTQQQTTWTDDLTPIGKKDVSRERWQRLNTPQPPHKDSFPCSIPPVCGSEDSQNLDEAPGECGEETLTYSCRHCPQPNFNLCTRSHPPSSTQRLCSYKFIFFLHQFPSFHSHFGGDPPFDPHSPIWVLPYFCFPILLNTFYTPWPCILIS